MFRHFLFISLYTTLPIHSLAEPVLVGMFYGANHIRVAVSIAKGQYEVIADGENIFAITSNEQLEITESDGRINLYFNTKNYTGYSKIELKQIVAGQFKAQPAGQKTSARIYEENLIALSYQGRLQLVNEVDIENYVSGVIEAESGSGQALEYYKVQAVISRTYALNNLLRHASEGYQICDATHCQVFHGKPRIETKANIATQATKDIVIVDHDINLITAAFHSNCGGHTINAEQVWSKSTTYLVGREDTFCLNMPHGTWAKSFTQKRWNDYLDTKRQPLSDDVFETEKLNRNDLTCFWDSTVIVPKKTIREDFKLRSAFFTTQLHEDSITFVGRGFGHGVGLCQEGAMKMASVQKRYEDIVHFYYKDVHLIPRYMMWFYRE